MAKAPSTRRKASGATQQLAAAAPVHVGSRIRSMLLGGVAQVLVGPLIGMIGGFMLLFGGIFLAIAWSTGPQPWIDSYRYAPVTAHVFGRIVESWAAIEFDPQDLPRDKLYWQALSKISSCVVVEYSGDWGAAVRRSFCGNRFDFREDFRFDDWNTMAPGVPFAFLRDASGFSLQEIRLSKTALDWISTHPPRSTFMLSKPPPSTALGALREQLDRPLDIALSSWTTPFPEYPLAYDPQHPDAAMPARWIEDRRQGFWWGSLIFTLILAAPGIFIWRQGWNILTGQSGAILWLFTLLPLCALPWWSEMLPRLLGHVNRDWAEVVSAMLDDINRVTRFSMGAPEDALQAHGERLVWHIEQGAYADTFGKIHFSLPQPAPKTPDAALGALRAQASAQMHAMNSAARAAIFTRLRQQFDAFARAAQNIFSSAAEDTLRDADADADAHRAAREFLIFASGGGYAEDQLDTIEVKARSN